MNEEIQQCDSGCINFNAKVTTCSSLWKIGDSHNKIVYCPVYRPHSKSEELPIPNRVIDVLKKVDYTLLREQKIALIHHINKSKRSFSIDCFDGLVEFLDNLQDAIVDDRIKTEYEVFGSTPR